MEATTVCLPWSMEATNIEQVCRWTHLASFCLDFCFMVQVANGRTWPAFVWTLVLFYFVVLVLNNFYMGSSSLTKSL